MKNLISKYLFLYMGLFLVALVGCNDYPKDTYNTLKNLKEARALRVGYAENPPWVISSPEKLDGIEVRITEEFATSLGVEVEWVKMNEQALLEELEKHHLDMVVSGLTTETPWKGKIGITRKYLDYQGRKHVLAIPPGEHRFLYKLEEFLNQNRIFLETLLREYALGDEGQ